MASTSKCEYCGGTVRSDEKNCPHCGASNPNYVVDTPRTVFRPQTIDELKEYCAERGMPLLRMRFFIGEDFKEPRAFGIYRDGDRFVVYKNKADGSRAIRYQGPDEAHAVNELFQKLMVECYNRGIYPDGKPVERMRNETKKGGSKAPFVIMIIIAVFWLTILVGGIASGISSCAAHRKDGYYRFDGADAIWYHYGTSWYYADTDSSDWTYGNPGVSDYTDYQIGEDYTSDWGVTDFKDSDTYDSLTSSSDSSYDSGYDSWDSGGTDWDSDW